MADSEHWYADGTCKVCPEVFYQLYTVHGQRNGRIFHCVFALLPNKHENTYNRFFQTLVNQVTNLGNDPKDLLVDFERSAINALQNREIEVKDCFFLRCSNIWKHVQNLGLAQRCNQEEEFALPLWMISALALLPPGDVIDGFEELSDVIRERCNDTVDDLLQYFEDTYIGRFRRNAPRRPPLFPIDLWDHGLLYNTAGFVALVGRKLEGQFFADTKYRGIIYSHTCL